jgi:hypothetical protein
MAVAITILTGCVGMNPSVVDPESYLGSRTNAPDVYRPVVPPVLLPVMDVRIDPMDRLFLVNFGDDPIYEGVELQTFPAADGGPAEARVLLWRPDTVDVYDPPDRTFDEDVDRHGLQALLSPRDVTLQRTDFDYRFRITEHGLDAGLRIRDREGRLVEVEVVETRGEPVVGGLIAPVGATSASPDYLPLFFLDEFALVKRDGTRVRISVDGRERSPSKMTRLMKGPASYFTRYSNRVVIAHWNERRDAVLEPVPLSPGTETVEAGGLEWSIRWNGERPEVPSVTARTGADRLTFLFSPSLPDLTALRPGTRIEGRFVVNVNDVPGVLAGEYGVERDAESVRLVFQPLEAWQPPMVRGPSWVSSYRYEAEIDLGVTPARLISRWERR